MTDRASIVAYLRRQADEYRAIEAEGRSLEDNVEAGRMAGRYDLIAADIEEGRDRGPNDNPSLCAYYDRMMAYGRRHLGWS